MAKHHGFNEALHPRARDGKFTSGGSSGTSQGHRGITISTKTRVVPLTVKTTKKGNLAVYPLPMRVVETNAHVRGKLIGQTNTRLTRKGAVVEQVHVTQNHQRKGIAKAMVAQQQRHLGNVPIRASSYQSDAGARLAKSLQRSQGVSGSKRVTNQHTAAISQNITDSFAIEQELFANRYSKAQAKQQKQAARAKPSNGVQHSAAGRQRRKS